MKLLTLSLLLFTCFSVFSQDVNGDIPNVFMDCQTSCYQNYVRQEVTYVNYMRDRQTADLYVLITAQGASAGAREVQLIFEYTGYSNVPTDTIKYIRPDNISNIEERELFLRHFKRGLLPALLQSSIKDQITYKLNHNSSALRVDKEPEKDPWNNWSFNARMNMNVSGEESFSEQEYYFRLTASRVTKEHKIFGMARYQFEESTFTLSDGKNVDSQNERYRAFTQYVKSLNDHWSAGIRGLAGSSSFSNTDFDLAVKPAMEYNIFPYSANSTKRFTVFYSAGFVYQNYTEITLFEKLEESLGQHGMEVEYQQTQKWGDLSVDVEFEQYFHDLSLYSVSFNPNIELILIKGLRLNFGGYIEFVGDRISITQQEVSNEDIILQNRQLDTNYSYYSYLGFNYRFGSANNNIVNPRF